MGRGAVADIASIGGGRAIQAQINPRNLRQREEFPRPVQVARHARATKKQELSNGRLAQAIQHRTQTANHGLRTRQADQALFAAQSESQDIRFSDRQAALCIADTAEEALRAQALKNEPGPPPPLPPREPTGTVLTPGDIAARDRLNSAPESILPRGSLIDITA